LYQYFNFEGKVGKNSRISREDEALSQWILNNWGVEVEVKDGQIVAP